LHDEEQRFKQESREAEERLAVIAAEHPDIAAAAQRAPSLSLALQSASSAPMVASVSPFLNQKRPPRSFTPTNAARSTKIAKPVSSSKAPVSTRKPQSARKPATKKPATKPK
jgi:hypothetical protein